MPGLQDLAPEILTAIIKNIPSKWGSHPDLDLYTVARTCRILFNVTEPFLYTKFIQGGSKRQTFEFVRTILQKPVYASRVQTIHGCIRSDDGVLEAEFDDEEEEQEDEEENGDEDEEGPEDSDVAPLIKALETYNLPSDERLTHEQWVTALKARSPEALFAIAMLSLPKIKTLGMTLEGNFGEAPSIFFSQAMTRASEAPDRFLQHLEEVTFSHTYSEYCINSEQIVPFLYLPSLRTVGVWNISAYEFVLPRPLTSSNVEKLDFTSGGVSDEAWLELMRPMYRLKQVTYSPGNPKHVGFMNNSPHGFGAGISLVRDTLEILSIGEYYLQYEDTLLSSLRDFPKLRVIDIQMGVLIGTATMRAEEELWEMLPSSLEKITFHGEGSFGGYGGQSREDIVEQVVDVVLKNESHFPVLRNIYMESFEAVDLDSLKEICSARGISFNEPR